jgi:hypothetical protein
MSLAIRMHKTPPCGLAPVKSLVWSKMLQLQVIVRADDRPARCAREHFDTSQDVMLGKPREHANAKQRCAESAERRSRCQGGTNAGNSKCPKPSGRD